MYQDISNMIRYRRTVDEKGLEPFLLPSTAILF